MFGFQYLKTGPVQYVLVFKNGKLVREGAGLSFWYFRPTTVVVSVPMGSVDVPFAFEETSADFQTVTVQGQVSYRVSDAKRIASLLDFTVNSYGRYTSDDPQKLSDRVVSALQVHAADLVHRMRLRELLGAQQQMAESVLAAIRQNQAFNMLGVEILAVSILSIRPAPETAKALEAEAREGLLRQADEAIYTRRNAAVEQERRIKESELATELTIQERKQQIRQRQIQADIDNEQQRQALIATQVDNDRKKADAQGYALEAMLAPMRNTDWRVLMATSADKMDPRTGVLLALREMAENAGKIGSLNISSELIESLMRDTEGGAGTGVTRSARK